MRLSVFALLLFAPVALAQPVPEVKDGKVTVPLTLTPAATPKPLSEYHLLADYRETQPGDKLSGFMKATMEQNRFYATEHQEKVDKWLELPLADLPADVREQAGVVGGLAYKPKYTTMMGFIDQAARYSRVEWNEYFNVRRDGVYFLLPEVQAMRTIGRAVHLRLRAEIKAGEFDKAVVSVRTLFGLAQMLETHPTLICGLVGLAVATNAVNGLEEMIAQPGCPNLYWSFADLPAPFLSLRKGIEGERFFVTNQFGTTVPRDKAMTDAEVSAVINTITEIQGMSGEQSDMTSRPSVKYALLATDDKRLDAIRERLTKAGTAADVVKAMPKLQLILLEDVRRFEVTRDEIFKWMNRPYPEALAGLDGTDGVVQEEKKGGWVLGPLFLPAARKVKGSHARLDQRLAYLMTAEAVRLHAHEHGGKLPEKLSDMKVAAPADPVSGKPFGYAVKDGVATLTGTNPTGQPTDNRVYELRLRK